MNRRKGAPLPAQRLKKRSRPGRIALRLLPFAAALHLLQAQTSLEELKGTDPAVFNTHNPAAYVSDFPFLPESDAMSAIGMPDKIPMDTLNDPRLLFDTINKTALPKPPSTPGDYNAEATFEMGKFFNVERDLASSDYPVPEASEISLMNKDHYLFYDIGRTATAFGLLESTPSQALPAIPEPSRGLEKEKPVPIQVGPFRLGIAMATSIATNDNVFGTQSDLKRDTIFSFAPTFTMEAGTKGFASLRYAPSYSKYAIYHGMDSADQTLSFTIRYPFTKLRLGADFSYITQSGLFVTSTGPAKMEIYRPSLFAAYPLGDKLTAMTTYIGTFLDSDPGGKKEDHATTFALDYKLGEKLTAGGGIQVGYLKAPIGYQNYRTLQLQAIYRPDYHIQLTGQGGLQFRHLSPPANQKADWAIPVFELIGSYHRTHNIALIMRLYREVSTDTFNDVNLQITTGIEGSALLRIARKTDFKLRLGVGRAEQFSNGEPMSNELSFLQGGVSISYSLLRRLDVVIFDNIQQRFADSLGQNYISNTIGLGFNVRF